ncbi:rhodanese-like domain-containing protein [Pseudonocardia acidicola]|uniref:Rhodanese-like domain-containing protein n=1 Tax=Pseudonocardia acidicola TaxID=2724939 RepID=A0ABX1S616_9PSEU|nr:rhodanese-like domain-containing protein [Pseudonocardia acidicola]NMH97014.1 rhodanese-like domain-containing protein [Pseudonocardia acidicola]
MNTETSTGGGVETADVPQVDPAEATRLIHDGALLVDVREPDEFAAGHAPGAVNMPLEQLDPDALPRDRLIVTTCRTGHRGAKAAARLLAAGFGVRNLAGGMTAWANAGLPVVRADGSPGTIAGA